MWEEILLTLKLLHFFLLICCKYQLTPESWWYYLACYCYPIMSYCFFLQILINLEIYDRLDLTIKVPIFPFPASFTYKTVVSMWLIHGLTINVDLRDKMMLITEDEKKKMKLVRYMKYSVIDDKFLNVSVLSNKS